jgi:hypothetical protein
VQESPTVERARLLAQKREALQGSVWQVSSGKESDTHFLPSLISSLSGSSCPPPLPRPGFRALNL